MSPEPQLARRRRASVKTRHGSVTMPRLIPLATLFVATWMLAGCGSGSSKARLSHEEYLQRIRAIEAGRHARAVDQLFFKLVTEPPMPKATCLARAREFDSHLHGVVN